MGIGRGKGEWEGEEGREMGIGNEGREMGSGREE